VEITKGTSQSKEWTTIKVGLRIDTFSLPDFKRRCSEAIEKGATKLVLDLEGTQFISMLGLRYIFELLQELKTKRGSLLLMAASEKLMRQTMIYSPKEIKTLFRSRKELDFL
jgi:anti-anti-sigma factor